MLNRRLLQSAAGKKLQEQQPQPPVSTSKKIIFLHHSTGRIIYYTGGVPTRLAAYNAANGTDYQISESDFPTAGAGYPWDNYPYDYWNIWINPNANATAKAQAQLDNLTANYDVIMFKHCFPVSDIWADTGVASVSNSGKRLENYKLQYAALKEKLHEYPNTTFIVWTGAAQTQDYPADRLARSREFFQWVKNEWDEPGDNIFVWDFYELETEGGNFIPVKYRDGDAHPNSTLANIAAPLLVKRMTNIFEGRGDSTSLTGA